LKKFHELVDQHEEGPKVVSAVLVVVYVVRAYWYSDDGIVIKGSDEVF
jgi:hypothetical protein